MDESAARRAHERADVDLRRVLAGVAVIVVAIGSCLGGAALLARQASSPAGAPGNAVAPVVEGPRQRAAPRTERETLLAAQRARLQSDGVDAATGRHHIPIDEAMRVLVQQQEDDR
jgi:hypothetical protein